MPAGWYESGIVGFHRDDHSTSFKTPYGDLASVQLVEGSLGHSQLVNVITLDSGDHHHSSDDVEHLLSLLLSHTFGNDQLFNYLGNQSSP